MADDGLITFKGSNLFKQRLLLATLSQKPIRIIEIRKNDIENPGLREYEVSLVRLFDKITNGSMLNISRCGTQVYYKV